MTTTTSPTSLPIPADLRRFLTDYASIALLLVGAMLSAVQVRLRVDLGTPLGADYVAQPPLLYVLLLGAVVLATVAGNLVRQLTGQARGRRMHFINHILATGFTFGLVAAILPDVSLLQLLYFTLFAAFFGLATIWWTPTLPDAREESTLFAHLQRLWARRSLLRLWTVTNIRARYSQTILGIMWIVMLPLVESLILAFVFSRIMIIQVDLSGNVPFVAFFLTAIAFWNFFGQSVLISTMALLGNMNIMAQVYFPREILVLVKFAEAMIDLFFVFVVTLIINAAIGVLPGWQIIYLPVILAVQSLLILGLMLFLSYTSVLLRDVAQFVVIAIQLLFYLSPILYPVRLVPPQLQLVLFVNPMSGVIEAYRDVLIYQRTPDFVSLYYPLVMGGILLYTGYLSFKAREGTLPDYV